MPFRKATRVAAALLAGLFAASLWSGAVDAAEPIKIGDLNSYTSLPAFSLPYRNGWRLALEELNDAGGVLGRPLEVISRDDGGKPGDAITVANELVSREGVAVLMGTLLSHVGLAVSDFARQKGIVFLAAEPLTDAIAWDKGNRYTFRLRPGTYVQAAMLAEEAAELPARRWAVIAPNYEYGQSAVEHFEAQLKARRGDVEFVDEEWPPLFKLDAGPVVEALKAAEPDAVYNVTFASDLAKFVREGRARGLFEGRQVVSLLTGEPEYLDPRGAEAPEGWIVTGYPWYAIDTPAHRAFVDAYQARWEEPPRMGSLVGYNTVKAIAAAIEVAGSTDTDALIAAFEGLAFDSPIGEIRFRTSDHQSTMGAWVGRTAVEDGKPVMVDWEYVDGASVLPSPEEVKELRPEG